MEKKSIKGTRTEHNLMAAFAGESQARSRYTLFAKKAREEGYEQIARIFKITAKQELTHAEQFFSLLEGGMVKIEAAYPAGVVADTMTNLRQAADGEREEWSTLYESFASTAQEEGFPQIAGIFKRIATVEKEHETRYLRLLERLTDDREFSSSVEIAWQCINCGYVYVSKTAPKVCPVCRKGQGWFERKAENF